ncbi:MAG: SDR family oxidoreductase [Alphaproteobacteria bacterium]
MPESFLAGRRAVVTGATRGIGRAIAARLVAAGADVLGTSTKASANLPQGCRHAQLVLDDPASLESFATLVERTAPHILVNNAAIVNLKPFEDIEEAEFRRIHRVNLLAPMRLCKAALPGMKREGWGRIVNIASIWGPAARAARAAYASTKSGLDVMTASLAYECAANGVLANCVSPGPVETEMLQQAYDANRLKALAERMPLKRLCQPDEVAAFVAWLAGPENTYITGQNLVIDGGFMRFC